MKVFEVLFSCSQLFREVADKSRLTVVKVFNVKLGPAFLVLRPHYGNMS